MPAVRTDGTEPFDPGVVSTAPSAGGGATNLMSSIPASSASDDDPMVFVGYGSGYGPQKGGYVLPSPQMVPASQLLLAFEDFTRDDYLKLRNQLIAAGAISETADPIAVRDAWAGVIERVAALNGAGKNISPLGYIKNLARLRGADPDELGAEDPFTGSKVYTNRSIADFTEGEAWSAIQSQLQQMLGRDPSDQELRDFTYRMNRLAAENPTISRTIEQYKDGEAVSRTTRTSGGFTAADMAKEAYDQAQNDPEYAEFQAAGTYFNALQQALGAIGG